MNSLNQKIAVVTGGSRGIGKAISIALAQAGAQVILTYVAQEQTALDVVADIENAGGTAMALRMDVRDRASVKAAFKQLAADIGHIDILVNNAGINKPTDFDQISDEDWDDILSVNLKGPFIVTQEALALLRQADHASVINIGSVSGQYGGPRTAHYAASKAGLISLSQVIARFGAADNIRCNTIAAGLIASDMAEAGLQAPAVAAAAKQVLLGRLGSTEEVAKAVVFLASDDSSYITAQTINVNGGLYF